MLGFRRLGESPSIKRRVCVIGVRFNSPGWEGPKPGDKWDGQTTWDRSDPKNPNRPHPFWKMVFPQFNREEGEDDITDYDRRPSQYYDFDHPRAYHRKGARHKVGKKHNWAELYDWSHQEFKKMSTPNYLKLTDEQLKVGCIGYMSEDDETDETLHPEYHLTYQQASANYKREVLEDKCLGRPSYEWQIPFGIDEINGYKSVITAADVMGNPQAIGNWKFDWEVIESKDNGTVLENKRRGMKITIVPSSEGAQRIDEINPDTVIFSYAADKNLKTVKRPWSARGINDRYGIPVILGWSFLTVYASWFPTSPIWASAIYAALGAINLSYWRWVCFMPEDMALKGALRICREQDKKVVFGDWLEEDYDERYFRSQGQDEAAQLQAKIGGFYPWQSAVRRYMHRVSQFFANLPINPARPVKSPDCVDSSVYPETYRDVVNMKRTDILANVLNNVEFAWLNPDPDEQDPDEIPTNVLMVVRAIDDLPVESVTRLITNRLTGKTPCPNPFVFTDDFERLSVEFEYPEPTQTTPADPGTLEGKNFTTEKITSLPAM